MWNIISLLIYSIYYLICLFIYLFIFTGLLKEWLGSFFKESELNPMLAFLLRN
jgi:hypothetical protein